ncbi:MAG TPA: hypothetical protein VM118_01645 [Acidobacteriota bacterium]|nr:hypothetical protein [Acidobacteriota bacterium]
MNIYFTNVFKVTQAQLDRYGAFNISLLSDLPLFIDPFLLFNSRKKRYQRLHAGIIEYLRFLRHRAQLSDLDSHLIDAWYRFPEVTQTWLGFSESGNRGRGLGREFAVSLHTNLYRIFDDFGSETITKGSHLEKLCLIKDRVGRDNISDFTTNLILAFLLEYTQTFARQHIAQGLRRVVTVNKARFNYDTETWERDTYDLPWHQNDYVILVPKDILTRDETWINRTDLTRDFAQIPTAIPNAQLRWQIDNYFRRVLPQEPSKEERKRAIRLTVRKFPQLIDYYILHKETRGDVAVSVSSQRVRESHHLYVQQFGSLPEILSKNTDFYQCEGTTYEEAHMRVAFLKDVIENKGGHRIFYLNGVPVRRESDIHILFRLTWLATPSDVGREVNNGRGPVDFKISRGAKDKTLVEFKLARNSQLRRNLRSQVRIYERASDAKRSIKVIFYFSESELKKVNEILRDLDLKTDPDIVLIDARSDNKPSGSKA